MSQFYEGGVVFHKATGEKCVVIKINDDGKVKVRTEKDLERDYFLQELKTEEEVEAEYAIKRNEAMEANKNRWGV